MSFHNITCHLSSLTIEPNDEVVIVPVVYSYISETRLVYGSNPNCQVKYLPLFGTLTDNGDIDLSKESNDACNVFRDHINCYLMNNDESRAKRAKQKYDFSKKYFIFKRESYEQADTCQHTSDINYIELSKNESRYLNIQSIDTNNDLLIYLSNGCIINIQSKEIERLTYIVIKKTVYDTFFKKQYIEKFSRIKESLKSIMTKEKAFDELYVQIGTDLLSKSLELINNGSQLLNELSNRLGEIVTYQDKFKNNESIQQFIEHIPHFAIIDDIYRSIGKSYYPNVRRHGSMESLYELNEVIQAEINKKREHNKKYWSVENGYCEDEAAKQEWF